MGAISASSRDRLGAYWILLIYPLWFWYRHTRRSAVDFGKTLWLGGRKIKRSPGFANCVRHICSPTVRIPFGIGTQVRLYSPVIRQQYRYPVVSIKQITKQYFYHIFLIFPVFHALSRGEWHALTCPLRFGYLCQRNVPRLSKLSYQSFLQIGC